MESVSNAALSPPKLQVLKAEATKEESSDIDTNELTDMNRGEVISDSASPHGSNQASSLSTNPKAELLRKLKSENES